MVAKKKQSGVMRLPKLANIESLKSIVKRVINVLETIVTSIPAEVA